MTEIILEIESIFILFFIGTFFITYTIIPIIIKVAEYKNYTDKPNNRSSHINSVPTLGGVAFFVTLIFVFFFINNWNTSNVSIYVIPGLSILFLAGIKDDILVISPASKLSAQVVAVVFVLANSVMQIKGLNGFLGIEQIPLFITFPLSVLIMVTLINAYNLIDGIDGLASIIGIIISISFGVIFYVLDLYYFAILSIIVFAMLLAFLRFNLSYEKKIFMGDTGSLIIGFILSILTIRILNIEPELLTKLPVKTQNFPFVIAAILIIPIFDLLRVFCIRIFNKKNPFKPDRNHAHHILINLGLSHANASLILGVFNLFFIVLIFYLSTFSKGRYIALIFLTLLIILFYAFYRLNFSFSNRKKRLSFRKKIDKIKSKVKKSK